MVMQMDYPNRKLPRLQEYDYSTPGAYFITIGTREKQCLFGRIVPGQQIGDAKMVYSPLGEVAVKCLTEIEAHFPLVKIDNWIIMPNHIHMLISITASTERIYPFPTPSISKVVGAFKAAVTRTAKGKNLYADKIWQTSFYDHIIRNDADYRNIWNYISGNPSKWTEDRFYTA